MPININLNPDLSQLKNVSLLKKQKDINEQRRNSGQPELNFEGNHNKSVEKFEKPISEDEIKEQERQRRRVLKVVGVAIFVAVAIPASTYLVNQFAKLVKASKGLSDAFKK